MTATKPLSKQLVEAYKKRVWRRDVKTDDEALEALYDVIKKEKEQKKLKKRRKI